MVIVTGGAGFIGSALVAKLNAMGREDILIVDNLGSSSKWQNLVGRSFADYLHKDHFRELLSQNASFGKVEALVHFGACSSTTETNVEYVIENNYRYSRIVAEWARHNDVRLIYASSAATYGSGKAGFDDADSQLPKLRPLNIYGYSKQLFDLWVLRNHLQHRFVGLKFFNVFGPNEYHKGEQRSVVHKAFEQIRATGQLRLFKSGRLEYNDGEQRRDFVYVKDCCNVIWWLLEHPQVSGIFNLGSGRSRTWLELGRAVFAALEKEPRIDFIPLPENIAGAYQYFTEARMEKLAATGCPLPMLPLEEAVRDYVQSHLLSANPHW